MTKNATEQQTKDIKRHFTKIKMTQTWENAHGYYVKKIPTLGKYILRCQG